jgi:DNA mismatch repair ATPase MutS
VKRYQELKEEVADCLLLMQVGVFMQVMDKDARAVSEVTGLKLRMAGEVDAPVVLGGFPNQRAGSRLSLAGRVGSASALYVQ